MNRAAVKEIIVACPGPEGVEEQHDNDSPEDPVDVDPPPQDEVARICLGPGAYRVVPCGVGALPRSQEDADEPHDSTDSDADSSPQADVELATVEVEAWEVDDVIHEGVLIPDGSNTVVENNDEENIEEESNKTSSSVQKTFWGVAMGLIAFTALGFGLGMGLRPGAGNDVIDEVIAEKEKEIDAIGEELVKKDEEIEEVIAEAANTQKDELFMYLMTLYAAPELNETDRCRNGYASSCGECWCAADDDWSGDEGEFICPPYPTGWIDSCTPSERKLTVSSHFNSYVWNDSTSNVNANEDRRLPRIADYYNQTESPLVIPTSDGGVTPCNPFGKSVDSINPFADLPLCFDFAVAADIDQHVENAVCVFKFTGGTNEVTPQTLALEEALASAENTEIIHTGPCGLCSTPQDVVSLIERTDSWYTVSNSCIIASVMASGTTVYGDTSLFKDYFSCYHDILGNSASCSMILAALVLGTSMFCDWQDSIFDTMFQTGDARFWYGGKAPTCTSLDNGCSIVSAEELFGLPELGLFNPHTQQVSVLVDTTLKCSAYLKVANISEHMILCPGDTC
mmetsp:Transcript_19319/g.31705  ORF Transcript_19319/g.31705 Transcript_19319/m.31705 type:complete len:568 (+) Transcript_19319:41-1744(+)